MKNIPAICNHFSRKLAWIIIPVVLFESCKKEVDSSSAAQVLLSPYSLQPKSVQLSAHSTGYYEYLPEGYLTATDNDVYPLLLFFHGGGEVGKDATALSRLLTNGPLKQVKDGSFPTSFRVNGATHRFIILAPQFTTSGNSFPDEVNEIIEYARRNYKVDASRIYLTGLSFGAGLCWNYVGKSAAFAHKIAAMVPVASYINEAKEEFKINGEKAQVIAASNLPVWSTHNKSDDVCPLAWEVNAHNLLKNSSPVIKTLPRLTVFDVNGHEGWTQTYDPGFKENNMNIYEWMLQYHR